ncbi:MAG: formylglycine-generating enzyme family protein [Kiritimatiellae bacterium]|nr:formylglycine-generating enzyme family protein [Kiritimatiellia bacterium]
MTVPTRLATMALAAALSALAASAAQQAEGARFALSSLIVAKDAETRNPTTEIAVKFGDVSHISPWRLRRRFPRSGGPRSGQPVTLRDALLAVNELVAKDEEMPEHTFAFNGDGMLASVCDVPIAQVSALFDGSPHPFSAALLNEPVRDFGKVEFQKSRTAIKTAPGPNAVAGGNAEDPASRKSGATKTITLPGGAKMEMIWCEPGSFMMGSPPSEIGRFEDEPLHPVTLTKGFWLGKYEVMQVQWESVMGENRSHFKGKFLPVDSVSWDDCQAFIRKVNVALGGTARLPTEAEWEYACRAGSTNPISGNGRLPDMAWYDGNSDSHTHDVGKNHPNAWGFYDMHGNVLEWCADWFSTAESQSVDPQGPSSGTFRVLRGGCWFFFERDCRSAYRLKRVPGIRNCIFGFRLACSEKGQ